MDFEWAVPEDDDDIITEVSASAPEPPPPKRVRVGDDPLKLFFDTIYASVRRMPREDIMSLRRKIFEMVCEAEEQQHYDDMDDQK